MINLFLFTMVAVFFAFAFYERGKQASEMKYIDLQCKYMSLFLINEELEFKLEELKV